MLSVNLLVEGLRLDSFAELPPVWCCCITLAGPGVLGGVAAAATASLGTSSSREDGIDAMLLLCECELGEVGVVGDMGGRDAGGGGDDAEGENQPRFGWGWAGMS